MADLILIFVAGVFGGLLNAIAGGGTFITFPALVFIGVPEIVANATSTVAAMPGYLSAAIGFRRDIAELDRALLLRLTGWTMLGGAIGSGLLLISSNAAFAVLVPFLLLGATLVFLRGAQVREWAARRRGAVTAFGAGSMVPVAIYGGYFNGGLGIVLLALFAMWGMTNLHVMNGLKSWLSFALSVVSLAIFASGGKIVWIPAIVMALGTIIGGLAGAPVSRRIPMPALRILIAAVGFGMTAVFLWRLIA
ncbi:sulfite exporter TauE/SafE family protein [Paracoccus sp. SCSIO 75233]|uniref:sulfite exporter TauE/SafE family protein n=1 Tax=Paracoccus sp. SCSIO 75233 TaxID=3017782 RepID=UPI0022F05566|nr:sulfite exporter TauE/SafE family protein [Paracoccus sp. SCSIO 75233]WBU54544.1 sulfite exporter TauE/SafE family protein [Paracoccus sp. SCSIO 75233]